MCGGGGGDVSPGENRADSAAATEEGFKKTGPARLGPPGPWGVLSCRPGARTGSGGSWRPHVVGRQELAGPTAGGVVGQGRRPRGGERHQVFCFFEGGGEGGGGCGGDESLILV